MQYVDLKMTESKLHTRMQYAYLQRCHICSIAYGLEMPVMQQGRSSPWKMIRVDAVDARKGVGPRPRGRSRPPPPATPAKAAPKRPSPPPPRTRLAEAKAAPNDLSGPATPATAATAPLPAKPAAATAATRGSASAPTPGGFRWGDSWIDGDLARDELHPWSKWLLRLRGCLWVMVHHLVSGGHRNDVQFLEELPTYFLPP